MTKKELALDMAITQLMSAVEELAALTTRPLTPERVRVADHIVRAGKALCEFEGVKVADDDR